jgi:hypothetical protein
MMARMKAILGCPIVGEEESAKEERCWALRLQLELLCPIGSIAGHFRRRGRGWRVAWVGGDARPPRRTSTESLLFSTVSNVSVKS